MELLIIKSGKDYIRFKDGRFLTTSLDKAGVYPLDKLELVKAYKNQLESEGFPDVVIKKLVLTEEDL